ncbi:hypothetical protein ACNKHL_16990 [Shigella flexneri]
MILNSSFDWNGVREPFVVATEMNSTGGKRQRVTSSRHRSGICRLCALLVTISN